MTTSSFHISRCGTPIGALTVVASDHAVLRVLLPRDPAPAPATENDLTATTCRQLVEYFNGSRTTFDVPHQHNQRKFKASVLDQLSLVPHGRTVTYSQLAAAAGNASAARAAGSACATNPLPILIPCHRVIAASGSIGNYRGGGHMKHWLLEHERRR